MEADLAYSWQTLLPSLVAIGVAFLTRQVFLSLFLGIWVGAALLSGGDFMALAEGLLRVIDTYLLRAIAPEDGSADHMSVVLFTLTVGGMIGIISANGGMRGVVSWVSRFANTPRRGQFAAYFLGFIVFFDDYANTLIVGKTARPLTDRLGVSREKLAFLVDATAAPLACVALVTTWIGFQISLIEQSMSDLPDLGLSAYEIFIESLAYSFYPILMLIFIALIIYTGRDFGPMATAEAAARARAKEQKSASLEVNSSGAYNAALPIFALILTTITSLFMIGEGDNLREILGSADPFKAMLWGSLISLIVAILVTLYSKRLKMEQIIVAMEDGFKPMLTAVMILTFSWAIADINNELGTASYIVSQIGDSLNPSLIPAIVFIIAAICAFATGSSWGTMGILVPLVLPLAVSGLSQIGQLDGEHSYLLFAAIASIMAGAVWGDHCSPISDTTILSSMASDCPHMNHVQTQMPYALFIAFLALIACVLPAGFGISLWIIYPVSLTLIGLMLYKFGKKID